MGTRARLAVALAAAYYGGSVVLALALVAGVLMVWAGGGYLGMLLAVGGVGAAAILLGQLVPPLHWPVALGPKLERSEHPRLHALLDEIGEFHAVHLELEPVATVRLRGKRRHLVLGLPLLATFDTTELRAAVAREHLLAGRWTWRIHPWVMSTADALAGSELWLRRVLHRPFGRFARRFDRLADPVSRATMREADAAAGDPDAAASVLVRTHAVVPAWDMYWQSDVMPMLTAGRCPPVAHGFAKVLANRTLATQLDALLRHDLETDAALRERIDALGVEIEPRMPMRARHPAIDLLDDVRAAEQALLRQHFAHELPDFDSIDWTGAVDIHLQDLRSVVVEMGDIFDGLSLGDAGAIARDLEERRAAVRERLEDEERELPDEEVDAFALQLLGTCATVAAADAGCRLTAPPGEPLRLHRGSEALAPFDLLARIAAGKESSGAWRRHPVVAETATEALARSAAPWRFQ